MSRVVEHPDNQLSVLTSTKVCPDLVPVKDYGEHRSSVVKGERVWWFKNRRMARKFLGAVTEGKYLRKETPDA